MPALPGRLGSGTLIVQHMPPGFTASLAARLDGSSELTVREAAGGEILDPSVALIAPGGRHLRLGEDRRTLLNDDAPEGGLKPRADHRSRTPLACSAAASCWSSDRAWAATACAAPRPSRPPAGRSVVEAENTCTGLRDAARHRGGRPGRRGPRPR
jgi:two-component system chemotaxis response regulator CheB